MKRIFLSVLVLFLLITLTPATIFAQNTNDFVFESFDADYYLSKDSENRSELRVVEKLVAEFPNFDQNHGIERAIPESYDGHSVNLHITSVENGIGQHIAYTTYDSGGNMVVRIGDADTYVHQRQSYVIEYTLQNVTKSFDDHDEFFWDTNGTEWQQSFGGVMARLHVPNNLATSLNGNQPLCFAGVSGSTTQSCQLTQSETSNETIITAVAMRQLQAHENMSFVVGFKPHTFAKYVAPPLNPIWYFIILAGLVWYVVIPIFVAVKAWRYWRRYGRDPQGKGTIIPEYIPPKDASIPVSSVILNDRMQTKAISAQLLDLAIQGYIKLYELDKKKYEIELVDTASDKLEPEEEAVLRMWFPASAQTGDRQKLDKNSSLYKQVQTITKSAAERAKNLNLMQDVSKHQKRLNVWGGVLLALSFVTFNVPGILASIAVFWINYYMPARTEKGVELRDYLHGLKLYMQTAEADRIKMLQAPDTAEKIDVNDKTQLVKLYERLLPYAMLFGIEKQWAEQFADLYTEPPDWYSGNYNAFNAALFAGSLSALSSSATSSFAPPSSSSSSGFSGGGSSGGGGGGGGGGGW